MPIRIIRTKPNRFKNKYLPNEGQFLKNTSFMFKTEEEKAAKLMAVLRQRTGNTLSDEQLCHLALAVKIGRQYSVQIHTQQSSFCESLVLVKSDLDNDVGTVVFGQALFGAATESAYQEGQLFLPSRQACAVITRKRISGGCITFRNEIHIYIPPLLYKKGAHRKYGQKQKETHIL